LSFALGFEIHLRSRFRAGLFLLIVIAPASLLAARTIRIVLAATWGDSLEADRLRHAMAIDPDDPLLHYTLGMVRLPGTETANPAEAVREMREAIRLSPVSAVYWSGLGRACYAFGDQSCADQAFERATELAPSKPRFAWEAAVNAVLGQRRGAAITQLKRYLDLTAREAVDGGAPPNAGGVFELLWRGFNDPELIWRELLGGRGVALVPQAGPAVVGKNPALGLVTPSDLVIPSHPVIPSAARDLQFSTAAPAGDTALKLAYLDFLCERDHSDLAAEYWAEIAATRPVVSIDSAKPYLERLLAGGHYPQATEVWQYLLRTGAITKAPDAEPTNLVFNGGFEQEPLNAGFDWRIHEQPYLDLAFTGPDGRETSVVVPANGKPFDPAQGRPFDSAPGRPKAGRKRALCLDFSVPQNSEYEPAQQFVPVTPGQSYILTAKVSSEEITSDSGPRLRVTDPRCTACLNAETAAAKGTSAWHEVSARFTAGPDTDVVRLSIWRPRSRAFPMEIGGRTWFSDIALHPVATNK
jgi:tetratricopeptide (TPR) repeat protein